MPPNIFQQIFDKNQNMLRIKSFLPLLEMCSHFFQLFRFSFCIYITTKSDTDFRAIFILRWLLSKMSFWYPYKAQKLRKHFSQALLRIHAYIHRDLCALNFHFRNMRFVKPNRITYRGFSFN